ncbi:MAG: hypothetical protein PHX13_03875 [Thiovulaceae bacterium]|nr:hypothetical protein [Sulfurimonadaceae bacterium]
MSIKLIFKDQDESHYKRLWDQYVLKNNVDFNYSLPLLEYYLSTTTNLFLDKSFVLEQDNRCVGICFLPIEKIDEKLSVSITGGYTVAPLANSPKNEKFIFDTINKLALELNIATIYFRLSPFDKNRYNILLAYNFVDTTNHTCTIDLQNTQEQLWMNLRKSYKALINSFRKNHLLQIEYSDTSNFLELHEQYVLFHKIHMINAGKIPKSDTIYNKQLNLIVDNKASIIAVKYNEKILITNYFFHDDINVLYASSAYDTHEEFKDLQLNHYLLWNAILYFKAKNFKTLGFGQPCSFNNIDGFDNYADEKELSISHFKRGMGVEITQQMQGIKFFDKELLLQKIAKFKSVVEHEI